MKVQQSIAQLFAEQFDKLNDSRIDIELAARQVGRDHSAKIIFVYKHSGPELRVIGLRDSIDFPPEYYSGFDAGMVKESLVGPVELRDYREGEE